MFYPRHLFRVALGCLKKILAVKSVCFELDNLKVQPMSLLQTVCIIFFVLLNTVGSYYVKKSYGWMLGRCKCKSETNTSRMIHFQLKPTQRLLLPKLAWM